MGNDLLIEASLQACVVVVLIGLAVRFTPGLSASGKVWLWRIAFAKLLLAFFPIDPIRLTVLPPAPVVPTSGVFAFESATPADPPRQSLYVLAWIAGAVLVALWDLYRVGRVARLVRKSTPVATDPVLDDIVAYGGFRRTPRLVLSTLSKVPMLVGGLRPTIVLPEHHSATPERRMMLGHEVAHLKRKDLLWNVPVALVRWTYFFHPFAWIALRSHNEAQESATDELALRLTGASAPAYAEMLIRASVTRRPSLSAGPASLGMASTYRNVHRRINAMKQFSNPPVGTRSLRSAVLPLLALVLVPVYELAPAQAKDKKSDDTIVITTGKLDKGSINIYESVPAKGVKLVKAKDGSQWQVVKSGSKGSTVIYRVASDKSVPIILSSKSAKGGKILWERVDGKGSGSIRLEKVGKEGNVKVQLVKGKKTSEWKVISPKDGVKVYEIVPDGKGGKGGKITISPSGGNATTEWKVATPKGDSVTGWRVMDGAKPGQTIVVSPSDPLSKGGWEVVKSGDSNSKVEWRVIKGDKSGKTIVVSPSDPMAGGKWKVITSDELKSKGEWHVIDGSSGKTILIKGGKQGEFKVLKGEDGKVFRIWLADPASVKDGKTPPPSDPFKSADPTKTTDPDKAKDPVKGSGDGSVGAVNGGVYRISQDVMLQGGRLVVVGSPNVINLISDGQTKRVPYLSDLPIIGRMFQSNLISR